MSQLEQHLSRLRLLRAKYMCSLLFNCAWNREIWLTGINCEKTNRIILNLIKVKSNHNSSQSRQSREEILCEFANSAPVFISAVQINYGNAHDSEHRTRTITRAIIFIITGNNTGARAHSIHLSAIQISSKQLRKFESQACTWIRDERIIRGASM